jgi:hypothetical protein
MRIIRRRNLFIKRIALGLAVAAFAAPVAQARVDGGSVPQSASIDSVARNWAKVDAAHYGMPRLLPPGYALSRGRKIQVLHVRPSGISSRQSALVGSKPDSSVQVKVASNGFDWGDTAIGAGLGLGLMLIGGGAVLATGHVRREQTA